MSAPETIKAVGKVVVSLVLLLTPVVLSLASADVPGPVWISTGLVAGYWFPRSGKPTV